MNKKYFLIFLSMLVFLTSCMPKQEIKIIQAEQSGITVIGQGEIKVAPDRARVVFNVVTRNKDVLVAKDQNQQVISKVINALKVLDVKDTNIKKNILNIYPEGSGSLYNATVAIQVTTQDLNKVENILTGVLKSTTTEAEKFYFDINIQGIYFEVSNMDYYRGQARSMALQDAKAKASIMANEMGQEIGSPISIQESPLYTYNYPYGTQNEYTYYRNSENAGIAMFDKIIVTSSITVEFSLK